jgi:uncharacterized protein YkwD
MRRGVARYLPALPLPMLLALAPLPLLVPLTLAGPLAPLTVVAPRVARAAELTDSDVIALLETQLFDLLNADRVANSLNPLTYDVSLASVARWRSTDMAERDYFSHDIGGYQVFAVLQARGITYHVAGENLALLSQQPTANAAAAADTALMNSPAHRAAILRAEFTHAGIGVSVAPDGRIRVTQLFRAE